MTIFSVEFKFIFRHISLAMPFHAAYEKWIGVAFYRLYLIKQAICSTHSNTINSCNALWTMNIFFLFLFSFLVACCRHRLNRMKWHFVYIWNGYVWVVLCIWEWFEWLCWFMFLFGWFAWRRYASLMHIFYSYRTRTRKKHNRSERAITVEIKIMKVFFSRFHSIMINMNIMSRCPERKWTYTQNSAKWLGKQLL